jgi:hypothetical protein
MQTTPSDEHRFLQSPIPASTTYTKGLSLLGNYTPSDCRSRVSFRIMQRRMRLCIGTTGGLPVRIYKKAKAPKSPGRRICNAWELRSWDGTLPDIPQWDSMTCGMNARRSSSNGPFDQTSGSHFQQLSQLSGGDFQSRPGVLQYEYAPFKRLSSWSPYAHRECGDGTDSAN